MKIDDLIAAGPDVTPIDDPRVRFYLDNRPIIDTWASLRDEAASALHDCLLELVDTLSADVEQLGEPDITIQAVDVDRGTPRVQMLRRSWIDDSGASPVAAVVEWTRALIDRNGNLGVYAGLRSKMSHPRSGELLEPLTALSADLKPVLGKPWQGRRGRYPLWTWIRPDGAKLDEAVLVAQARRELWRCWALAASPIDALLQHHGEVTDRAEVTVVEERG